MFAKKGDRLFTLRQNENLTWPSENENKWKRLGGGITGNPVAGVNEGERIEVFVSGTAKNLRVSPKMET